MKYFLDTEFIEGVQESFIKPTIDLISIGIYCQDGREYYAISKEFNLDEAWNRNWIRENIIKPIWVELICKELNIKSIEEVEKSTLAFTYSVFKTLLYKYGKYNKDIANDIKEFVGTKGTIGNWEEIKDKMNTQFYGYYCDYDWVVFCWLFGFMLDLPEGFPMYCIDLKQELDRLAYQVRVHEVVNDYTFKQRLDKIKNHPDYPKQQNEHNALADAKWNYELFNFLKNL